MKEFDVRNYGSPGRCCQWELSAAEVAIVNDRVKELVDAGHAVENERLKKQLASRRARVEELESDLNAAQTTLVFKEVALKASEEEARRSWREAEGHNQRAIGLANTLDKVMKERDSISECYNRQVGSVAERDVEVQQKERAFEDKVRSIQKRLDERAKKLEAEEASYQDLKMRFPGVMKENDELRRENESLEEQVLLAAMMIAHTRSAMTPTYYTLSGNEKLSMEKVQRRIDERSRR